MPLWEHGRVSDATALPKLLSVASPGLGAAGGSVPGGLPASLAPLWAERDGWVAFWSALQVFPAAAAGGVPSVAEVNAALAEAFGELAAGHVAFGQDLFGVLFTWHEDHVCAFDPETAEHEPVADDVEGWAAALLAEPEELVGSAFAFDWQERHGAVEPGERLVPLLPFVLGGEYDDGNLEPRGSLQALRERAALARVVATLPDGAEVEWPLPGTREG
ncbi:MAG: hypothetical protein JWO90_775 [Solirubrobacterales bacterium]|jgi:hypothetical protein|nr:hypothetical protein [Solirubrobacterales bacterium]